MSQKPWQIWIDTGGTFSDCIALSPENEMLRLKILSNSSLRVQVESVYQNEIIISGTDLLPDDFFMGYTLRKLGETSEAKIDAYFSDTNRLILSKNEPIDLKPADAVELLSPEEPPVFAARLITKSSLHDPMPPLNMKLATTKGTNALLEGKGGKTALFITKGFKDLLLIGTQQRPELFALKIDKKPVLYTEVVEIEERLDAKGNVLDPLNRDSFLQKAQTIFEAGIKNAAVVCMHSYANPIHEIEIKKILSKIGFTHISLSSELVPFMGMIAKTETTVANAVLSSVIDAYLNDVEKGVGSDRLLVMSSAGALAKRIEFQPKDSLLSGPAGGVVGAASVAANEGFSKAISFDMGGTSTDVARIDGSPELTFEHKVGNAHLVAPAIHIETVAAGGGSMCYFDGYTLRVGPESAGAVPGPACYGAGGPLTITDLNLLSGKLSPDNFQIPVFPDYAKVALEKLQAQIQDSTGELIPSETLIRGFLDIANERMADAIRSVSAQKGYDIRDYALVSFGGAGGQHACSIADLLGIKHVILPENAGLLSAYGLGKSMISVFEERQILLSVKPDCQLLFQEFYNELLQRGLRTFQKNYPDLNFQNIEQEIIVSVRFKGQHHSIDLKVKSFDEIETSFKNAYFERFGHWLDGKIMEIVTLRVRISEQLPSPNNQHSETEEYFPSPKSVNRSLIESNLTEIPVYEYHELNAGAAINGPAIIYDDFNTIVVEEGWKSKFSTSRNLILEKQMVDKSHIYSETTAEAIELELFTNRLTSVATEMGNMLQRTAMSVNVKDRLDFSCALLSPEGNLVVNAPHIPVHLGALGLCVRTLKERFPLNPGDVLVTNHPAYGGSHLPDITVVTPVFNSNETLLGFAASRAHHAELGGKSPGSMPPDATCLAEEGVVIPPFYLYKSGVAHWNGIESILSDSPFPSRNIPENMADLKAAVAANQKGRILLLQLAEQHGEEQIIHYMQSIREHAARKTRDTLSHFRNLDVVSEEYLDDGTILRVRVQINDAHATFNFTGTSSVHPGNLNATPAIINSVVMYVLRLLTGENIPLNEGILDCVTIILPECLLNPDFHENPLECPAVVGGNTEVSQRLTDTLLKPFEIIACSQGTMNNVLFGNHRFGYYETVGGGTGAGNGFDGADAVHHHMTNTRGTDPEILEYYYPVRLDEYSIRENSGGDGQWKGGNGIIRKLTFLDDVTLTVMTQHRLQAPYGMNGGLEGCTGEQFIIRKNGEIQKLKPSDQTHIKKGDQFILKTPGGGGYGKS